MKIPALTMDVPSFRVEPLSEERRTPPQMESTSAMRPIKSWLSYLSLMHVVQVHLEEYPESTLHSKTYKAGEEAAWH